MSKNSRLSVFYKWLVNRANRKWRKDPRVFSADDYYSLHEKNWADRSSHLLKQHFSPEETEVIHKEAKKAGVSVNTFIATAFLEADGMKIVEPTFYKNSVGFDRDKIEFYEKACQRTLSFCENK